MNISDRFNNQKQNLLDWRVKHFGEAKNKGKSKSFFSQLSRGLMLPIAILPIAGLLLGIGGAIGANVTTEIGGIFANIFKGMSDVVFANLPILFAVAITITFSKDKGASGFCALLAYLVFCSSQLAFIQKTGNDITSILWFHKGDSVVGITTTTLGFTTLQTSIFGGIIVGGLTSFIYNRISKLKLPTALDFFSGIRLVPILLIPSMFLLSLLFLVFWPWIGLAIFKIGSGIQGAPSGTGGLLYGILGRALMPFGLHHIPIVLAFQTAFGGVITQSTMSGALAQAGIADTDQIYINIMNEFNNFGGGAAIEGDQNIWNFINSLPYNTLPLNGVHTPIFDWFTKLTNTYPGRYTQDYPTYLGVCIGIGAALIVTSEKKNRRDVSVVIGSAMIVSFLTGITEPLEFTFLFCAPWLYYLFYVPLSGFSYMFMELANAHIGVGFARGFIDLIIYGAIPVLKGTNFYWAFVLALAEGLFAFLVFWFFINKFNIQTPGRGNSPMNLMSKKEYHNIKNQVNNKDERIIKLIHSLGGKENIVDVSACATRLRVNVKTTKDLEKSQFALLGSKGEIIKESSLQIIFGGEATILADKVNDLLSSNGDLNTKANDSKAKIKENENIYQASKTSLKFEKFSIYAPCNGTIYTLENVPDDAFSNKMLGDGIAIKPSTTKIYSPLKNAKVSLVSNQKHCYSFVPKNNSLNVMMHIGIDSIENANKIFKTNLETNQIITKETLITNINLIELKKCKSLISPIVIIADQDLPIELNLKVKNKQVVKKGDLLMVVNEVGK